MALTNGPPMPSYLDPPPPPSMNPRIRVLCDIVSKVPVEEIDHALARCGVSPLPEYAEEVLKLCYGYPSAAVKFFRWSGSLGNHTQYSWNLMIDLLGKNGLFETMWNAVRSMKQEGVLSLGTFASVFGSYCKVGKFSEAVMTFDVLDRYGIPQDVVAVNSLLSAICREEKQTARALEFFEKIKTKVPPDADTFAILLEGWEKEGNVAKAKNTFGEMVIRVGWSPNNMSAYDAFLITLVRGSQADEAVKFLHVMKGKNCLPGMKFFSNAFDILVKKNDFSQAVPLWEIMVGSGLIPSLGMYNGMIGLLCNNNEFDNALRFLDEMVYYGAFPDALTYNTIFKCLVKNKKVRLATSLFKEMLKNEEPPLHYNCEAAIQMFFDNDDPEMAIEVWTSMLKNSVTPVDISSNELLLGLCRLDRLTDVRCFLDDMLDRRIIVFEATMKKLKQAFYEQGRSGEDMYHSIAKRWKAQAR